MTDFLHAVCELRWHITAVAAVLIVLFVYEPTEGEQ